MDHFIRSQDPDFNPMELEVLREELQQFEAEEQRQFEEATPAETADEDFVDVEHDGDFVRIKNSHINFDDCPKIEVRDRVPCKRIEDNPQITNFKKIVVKVPSHEVKKGGFFSSDYALFDVETEIPGMKKQAV